MPRSFAPRWSAHAGLFDRIIQILQFCDAPRLRVGLKDVTREEFSTAVNAHLGKQRVSIMLDGAIIAFFKARAGERGYQTLISQALHEAITCAQIESTLRRLIREELHPE